MQYLRGPTCKNDDEQVYLFFPFYIGSICGILVESAKR